MSNHGSLEAVCPAFSQYFATQCSCSDTINENVDLFGTSMLVNFEGFCFEVDVLRDIAIPLCESAIIVLYAFVILIFIAFVLKNDSFLTG